MKVDRARAAAVFEPDLDWLLDRLEQRLAHGRGLSGRVQLTAPSPEQRNAVERLLGRRPTSGRSLSIDLDEVARVLARAGIAGDLADLVTALRGPITDRVVAAEHERLRWENLHRRVRAQAVAIAPQLGLWADDLAAQGLLRRLAGQVAAETEQGQVEAEGDSRRLAAAETLAEQALAVHRRLPTSPTALAQFAAEMLGDSHALDDDTALSTLVLRGIASRTGQPSGGRDTAQRRALWAQMGLQRDELSAPVLVTGLRPGGESLLPATLRAHADAGEPCRLTLRALLRQPVDWTPLREVRVLICENPTVVAAIADRWGMATPPTVCTDGQPAGAAQALLGALTEAGAILRFHVDFDAGGIRIGNLLCERFGAQPWRMGTRDYERAARHGTRQLHGNPSEAAWDPELAPALRRHRVAVHEEQLLSELTEAVASELA